MGTYEVEHDLDALCPRARCQLLEAEIVLLERRCKSLEHRVRDLEAENAKLVERDISNSSGTTPWQTDCPSPLQQLRTESGNSLEGVFSPRYRLVLAPFNLEGVARSARTGTASRGTEGDGACTTGPWPAQLGGDPNCRTNDSARDGQPAWLPDSMRGLCCISDNVLHAIGDELGFAAGLGLYEHACEPDNRSMPAGPDAFKLGSLVFTNDILLRIHDEDRAVAHTKLMKFVNHNMAIRKALQGLLKNVLRGDLEPVAVRCLHVYHSSASVMSLTWLYPCQYHDGNRLHELAYLMVPVPQRSGTSLTENLMQDHIALKNAPTMITTVDSNGQIVAQNSASFGALGFHGRNHRRLDYDLHQVHYLKELFHNKMGAHRSMLETTAQGASFSIILQITSPTLLSWLDQCQGVEVFHEIQISTMAHPDYMDNLFIVCETDVTETIATQRQLENLQELQRDLLSEILPPQVVDKLLDAQRGQRNTEVVRSGSGAEAPPGRVQRLDFLEADSCNCLTQRDVMSLATYHEQVTILFTDIVGFTALSQQLHPSEVMLLLNNLYSIYDGLCELYDVYKVETIGDCFMVAGGLFAPEADGSGGRRLGGHDPQHASKVMAFARAILVATSSLRTPLGTPVSIRVGIHSGPCMSGVVGRKMPRFCLFGDTINTASRMESTGQPDVIHVSQASCALLPNEPWRSTGGVFAKGKGQMTSYTWAGDELTCPCPTMRKSVRRRSSVLDMSGIDAWLTAPRHPAPNHHDGSGASGAAVAAVAGPFTGRISASQLTALPLVPLCGRRAADVAAEGCPALHCTGWERQLSAGHRIGCVPEGEGEVCDREVLSDSQLRM